MSTSVIAIDPGERTGFATGLIENGELHVTGQRVLPLKEFALWFHDRQQHGTPWDVVVYETWRLRPNAAKAMIGNDFQTSQLVGMIRLCAWTGLSKLHGYGPELKFVAEKSMPQWCSDRKKLSSEEHDKDALDLLWYYAFTEWGATE